MKELLAVLVKSLVTYPNEINIVEEEDDNNIILKLAVHKTDIGKIIGKNGKVIRSIRTVVKAGAYETKKRIIVEIVE